MGERQARAVAEREAGVAGRRPQLRRLLGVIDREGDDLEPKCFDVGAQTGNIDATGDRALVDLRPVDGRDRAPIDSGLDDLRARLTVQQREQS